MFTFGFDAVNGAKLTGRSPKDSVKDFRPGVRWILPSLGQRRDQSVPIEYLRKMGFKLVAVQAGYFSFPRRNRRRLRPAIWAAASSKRLRSSTLERTSWASATGTWKVLGLPWISTES